MHDVMFYEVVDNDAELREPLRAPHLAHARRAVKRGELVLGGALAHPIDGAVLLFRDATAVVAEGFATADRNVLNRLVKKWRVREWSTVVGKNAEIAL